MSDDGGDLMLLLETPHWRWTVSFSAALASMRSFARSICAVFDVLSSCDSNPFNSVTDA